MTLAQFVVAVTIALTTIAVALIVGAVILMEKEEKRGGVTEPRTLIEFENGPATITPINRARVIEWIPVEERLPDNMRNVLVSVNYAEDVYAIRIAYWHNQEWQGAVVGKVAAWAELPEPYKK